jgi:hypothetical protein|tara:strand:- start:54 stop:353 length:300 start_codon:yes stop_codon:yes gene_type:complete
VSKFTRGDKAPKQTAINSLLVMISNYYEGRYEVIACSDDGGAMLEVQIEVENVSRSLEEQAPTFPFFEIWPIWMGWRAVIVKVPPGYIDAITLAPETDY